MSAPRIIFAGTPEFALASLSALVNAGNDVVAVYAQPDRPAGRGRRISAGPVKCFAEERGIVVRQPPTLRDDTVAANLQALQADILIVAAYGLILPQNVLDIPTHGCLNVHASVLPRWRGAAPIQAAILAGDRTTGVSLMGMTAGLDCGPVFSTSNVVIAKDESAGQLHDRLAMLGSELLVRDLPKIIAGDYTPVLQDESLVTVAPKIRMQDAELDWTLSAEDLHRRIRAYNPVPGSFFLARNDVRVKVWEASVIGDSGGPAGSFTQYDRSGIVVACGRGALKLSSLQLPGRRRVASQEFVNQIDLR